jgi:soluble P-type ATPase
VRYGIKDFEAHVIPELTYAFKILIAINGENDDKTMRNCLLGLYSIAIGNEQARQVIINADLIEPTINYTSNMPQVIVRRAGIRLLGAIAKGDSH